MAPPETNGLPLSPMNAEGSPMGEEKAVAGSTPEKVVDATSSSKAKGGPKLRGDAKEPKLSGAELKRRAKEEKSARRAKEKQEKPILGQPDVLNRTQQDQPAAPDFVKSPISGAPGTKQQKRRGSSTTTPQRQIPIRTSEPHAPTVIPAPKKDNKNVSLFSHLYGHPRRSTMAGAAKDIHPAVVVLGLKMSHYIICGSNARCVAMLLAFTRVCLCSMQNLTLAEYR